MAEVCGVERLLMRDAVCFTKVHVCLRKRGLLEVSLVVGKPDRIWYMWDTGNEIGFSACF